MSDQTLAVVATASVERDRFGIAYYRIGGREYPMISEPQCHVCQSEQRREIEQHILDGAGWATVHRRLPEATQAQISVDSIKRHARKHLPADLHVRREIIEQRAKEIGRSIEDDTSLGDYITFARLGVQRVMDRLARGEIDPDIQDGIALANFLLKAEQLAGGEVDQDAVTQTFVVWARAMQRNVPAEVFSKIMRDIGEDPIIKALIARAEGRVIDASATALDGQEGTP